ncbi:hypothetical protein [Rhizobium sophoriradicis]|uniref:hypothetical protein n=1 Tax=Rhizobium sophoriradicis TaxID=1535245 RepID=UPI001FD9ADE9|nr:hypothetical protein [Rhizobium sophoriradicis]
MKDVTVGAANAAGFDADQQFTGAGCGFFDFAELQLSNCLQTHGLHSQFLPCSPLLQEERKQEPRQAVDASPFRDGTQGIAAADQGLLAVTIRRRLPTAFAPSGNNILCFRFAVEKLEAVMVDPKDKEPAEGSRETVDNELARQGEGKSHGSAGRSGGQKGPAQPGSSKK